MVAAALAAYPHGAACALFVPLRYAQGVSQRVQTLVTAVRRHFSLSDHKAISIRLVSSRSIAVITTCLSANAQWETSLVPRRPFGKGKRRLTGVYAGHGFVPPLRPPRHPIQVVCQEGQH